MAPLPHASAVRRADGKLVIELDAPGELSPGAPLEVFSLGADAVVLLRAGQAGEGYFAGTLRSLSIPEIFGQIVSGIRTGKLVVSSGSALRTVSFSDGQVCFATSTELHEQLGAVLLRLGLLTQAELDRSLAELRPGGTLGQELVRAGRLPPGKLYSAVTFLVREIVVNLFESGEGQFIFLEGMIGQENAVKLPERTRDLILEGIRRGEDVLRLRQRLPPELRVERGPGPVAMEGAQVADLARGGALLSDLRQVFEGSEYAFLCWVDELMRSRTLVEAAPASAEPRPERPAPRSPLELYDAQIALISGALRAAGKGHGVLEAFLQEPLPGVEQAFAGVSLTGEGHLDVSRVLANCSARGAVLGRVEAYEALSSFISYALFSARDVLPPDEAVALEERLRKVREGIA